jgi:3D (Asp-Asp-Asp) domain-containing protein
MRSDISVFIKYFLLGVFVFVGFFFSVSVTHIYGEKVIPESEIVNTVSPRNDFCEKSFSISYHPSTKTFYYEMGKKLYLYCDGAMKTLRTDAKQVETLLKKEKITLSKEDFISKPLNYYVMDSDLIQVKRVRYLEYIVDEPISFTSISQTNPLVANGIKAIWQPGEKGILRYQIRERFEDGILKEKKVLSKTRIKEPTIEIIALGSGFFSGKYKKKFRMCASSYNPTVEQCDGDPFTTATGIRVRYGVVAVDPSVIKLGSKLWVSGYGYAIAADTGGLIKKMKIDLFFWKRLPNENWKGGFIDVYLLE